MTNGYPKTAKWLLGILKVLNGHWVSYNWSMAIGFPKTGKLPLLTMVIRNSKTVELSLFILKLAYGHCVS